MITENLRRVGSKPTPPLMSRVLGRRDELSTDPVYLVFTSFEETLTAIPVASRLARALRSRLTVVHFKPVAFGAPLEHPCGLSPVETDEFKTRLEAENCDAEARVCLCREAHTAFSTVFNRPSLVVMGRNRRWWRTPDRWCRALEAAGHLVVLVDEQAHA